MEHGELYVLAINAGSSSIKFTVYRPGPDPRRRWHGKIDRIGSSGTSLEFNDLVRDKQDTLALGDLDHQSATNVLIEWLERHVGLTSIRAVGHRLATGGANYKEPQRVTQQMLGELRRISAYAPEHLPSEIALIDVFHDRVPQLPQVACFDTAFHRDMPRVAKILAIPRRFEAKGVERQGFHGLSYSFLMEELGRAAGRDTAEGRVIMAHLGNGASLAAVRGGKCIDTSMGFTPVAGVPMSTRSGDLDPGLVWYLSQTEQMSADQFHQMVNHQSGLLGVSETSSDVRDLLRREANDSRAAEAIDLFCYQVRKWIGAFAAALDGVDTLIFTAGIGENAPVIRSRICDGLGFLGIQVDETRNAAGESTISPTGSRATVRVIRTDEEVMIAKAISSVLDAPPTIRNVDAKE
jgi:acetate kinase